MTILATDLFTPAANPLPTANWTTVTGSSNLQATGTACEPTTASATNRALYTGVSFPANQYAKVKIGALPNSASIGGIVFVRSSPTTAANNYQVQLIAIGGLGSATCTWSIRRGATILVGGSFTLSANDFVILGMDGTTLTLYKNGTAVPLATATDATFASGDPGIGFITSTDALTDYQLLSFEAGSIVQAAAPTFSPAAGTYTGSQTVTLSSSTASSTIYYTTDGTTPTTSSSSVPSGGTIVIASTLTLKAIALSNGPLDTASTETDALYTINSASGSNGSLLLMGTGN